VRRSRARRHARSKRTRLAPFDRRGNEDHGIRLERRNATDKPAWIHGISTDKPFSLNLPHGLARFPPHESRS
jgi:hypothetical protein